MSTVSWVIQLKPSDRKRIANMFQAIGGKKGRRIQAAFDKAAVLETVMKNRNHGKAAWAAREFEGRMLSTGPAVMATELPDHPRKDDKTLSVDMLPGRKNRFARKAMVSNGILTIADVFAIPNRDALMKFPNIGAARASAIIDARIRWLARWEKGHSL